MRRVFPIFGLFCIFAGTIIAATVLASESAQSTEPVVSDCLDCHSDIDLLQILAEEEDIPEPPSEGSG